MQKKKCHNVIYFEQLESTNEYALELLHSKKAKHKDLIWTKNQTEGQGLSGNKWYGVKDKNLTFSIVYDTSFLAAEKQFYLNKAISLSVFDFVKEYLKEQSVYIKWPNDILINQKKVAGILIHHIVLGNQLQWTVVGVGININQKNFPSYLSKATSLTMHTKEHYDLSECLQNLSEKLLEGFDNLQKPPFDLLSDEYMQNLYQANQWCKYKSEGKYWKGRIIDVNLYGQLVVEKEDFSQAVFNLKEIEFL